MKIFKIASFFSVLAILSCSNKSILVSNLEKINSNIEAEYAPDKRVIVYDIEFNINEDNIIISGETSSETAYQNLLDSLKILNIAFQDDIRILPDATVGSKSFAVARNSVINIRSKPKHSAELGTQGLLGMPLKILDKKGDFYRVQTPDNYISWVDKGGITRMTKEEFEIWNNYKRIIFTNTYGFVYADKTKNSEIISDITLGGILKYVSMDSQFFEVVYPDKRKGYLKREESMMYESWLHKLNPTSENIESIAKSMDGFPYLWGGTSSKGMDCSGFTKMVYLMNGFIIPRDASQQINAGKTVDENLDFSDLQKGDLLFFGKKASKGKRQRVTHVGIWLGNQKEEFIHASGNVHLSSMDANHINYDEFNKNRYLGSKRYLGVKDDLIIDLK
ncbi:MAG: C40 family peptidase [Polaribacter sp.]|nr:C40 family peptidase [Polaribacter sp.]